MQTHLHPQIVIFALKAKTLVTLYRVVFALAGTWARLLIFHRIPQLELAHSLQTCRGKSVKWVTLWHFLCSLLLNNNTLKTSYSRVLIKSMTPSTVSVCFFFFGRFSCLYFRSRCYHSCRLADKEHLLHHRIWWWIAPSMQFTRLKRIIRLFLKHNLSIQSSTVTRGSNE